MSPFVEVRAPIDDRVRGDQIFSGHVLRHSGLATLTTLTDYVEQRIRTIFAPHDPQYAHASLTPAELLDAVVAARGTLADDPLSRTLFGAVWAECGADVEALYWDKLTLRVLPPSPIHAVGPAAPIGFHRDTWSSGISAQMNWWATIYPLDPARTFALYPAYWSRPLANSSESWDPAELLRARAGAPPTATIAYPIVPEALEPADLDSELRVLISPRELLCFSSAHLHASVPNTSERTRFSVEARTVNIADLERGAGAPNIDGPRGKERYHWYRQVLSNQRLGR